MSQQGLGCQVTGLLIENGGREVGEMGGFLGSRATAVGEDLDLLISSSVAVAVSKEPAQAVRKNPGS
jgi:hypothetical protein